MGRSIHLRRLLRPQVLVSATIAFAGDCFVVLPVFALARDSFEWCLLCHISYLHGLRSGGSDMQSKAQVFMSGFNLANKILGCIIWGFSLGSPLFPLIWPFQSSSRSKDSKRSTRLSRSQTRWSLLSPVVIPSISARTSGSKMQLRQSFQLRILKGILSVLFSPRVNSWRNFHCSWAHPKHD